MNQEFANTMVPGLNPGDKLGYFQVQSQIATGGMSLIWKGYDKLLDRDVAIKQIASSMGVDEVYRERFRKEAQIQKKLAGKHPALIDVYDFIDDERGLFIVMEYVDGLSLDQLLDQLEDPIPPKQALAITAQAASALHVIHQEGVIHRDLKPANILLPKTGGVRVADFGLATLQVEQDALSMGTARYMAPELFGEEETDARADIYSLGIITYEMLAGRPAFEQAFRMVLRDQRQQAMRWMKWHTNQKVEAQRLDELNEEIPTELADLVHRMIDKDPGQRIESAGQLVEVIKRNFDAEGNPRQRNIPTVKQPTAVDVAVSQNPTAPLPKRSLVIPILLGMMLLLLGVGGYMMYDKYIGQPQDYAEARRAELIDRFEQAIDNYKAAEDRWTQHITADPAEAEQIRKQATIGFTEAIDEFEELAEIEPTDFTLGPITPALRQLGPSYIDRAQSFLATAQGDDALEDRRFEDAATAYLDADTELAQAEEKLQPWLDRNNADIKRDWIVKRRNELKTRAAFATKAKQIRELIDKADYGTAVEQFRNFNEDYEGALTADEEQILVELQQLRVTRKNQSEIDQIRRDAQALAARGELEEAQEKLEEALEDPRYDSPALRDLLSQVKTDIGYALARQRGREAEANGEWQDAIDAYTTAMRLKPGKADEIRKLLPPLRGEIAYEKGLEARTVAEKKKWMQRAGDNPKAKAWLEEHQLQESQADALAVARNLMRSGRYEEAIEKYVDIQEQWPEVDVADEINRCRFAILTRKADEQERAGQYRAAIATWNTARSIQPDGDRTDIDNRVLVLQTKIEIEDLIAAGDRELAEGNFSAASRYYRQARQIAQDVGWKDYEKQANDRLQEASYKSNIAQARAYLSQKKYKAAQAALNNAKAARPEGSKEIDQIQRELDKYLGEQE